MSDGCPEGDTATEESSSARAANQNLLQSLIAGLVQDPEVDLLSLVPASYSIQIASSQNGGEENVSVASKAAALNRKTLDAILSQFDKQPEANLLDAFPAKYEANRKKWLRSIQNANQKQEATQNQVDADNNISGNCPNHTFFVPGHRLEAESFKVVAPLSPAIESLLQNARAEAHTDDTFKALIHLIRASECIWLGPMAGRFVLKINDDFAVKVTGSDQRNHHAALELLATESPALPIPRSHGLIWIAKWCLLFTPLVPGLTLEAAWPTLNHQQKSSITVQLDDIFTMVREISRDGRPLGLINGNGVSDERNFHDDFRPQGIVQTVAEFEDFVHSHKPWISNTYVEFLKMMLPASRLDDECVFTHTDVRPANIMVDKEGADWKVTGILDWDGAGFYPPYWEAVKSTRAFLANDDSDWYLMQPQCIAPSKYANQWLADRLWDDMTDRLSRLDRDPRVREAAMERQKLQEDLWEEHEQRRTLQRAKSATSEPFSDQRSES